MIINERFLLATVVVGGKLISITGTLTGNFREKKFNVFHFVAT